MTQLNDGARRPSGLRTPSPIEPRAKAGNLTSVSNVVPLCKREDERELCPLCGRGPGPYHQQCNAAIAAGVD